MPITPPLDAARITALTGAETRFTRHGSGGISCVARTDSTNATLVRYVREGGTGSRVLIADRQDAGHGRFSRSWQAPAGTSLLMSVLVPVSASRLAGDWGWLSMAAGLAVTEAVERLAGIGRDRVTLKWPNDVLLDLDTDHGGKLCGILSERVDSPAGAHAVIGMGLNVRMDADQLPVPTATSMSLCGLPDDREKLAAELVLALDRLIGVWLATGTVRGIYRERCDTIGTPVRLTFDPARAEGGPAHVDGIGADIDLDGSIVVDEQGRRRSFSAADVQHLRPAPTLG